MFGFIADWLRWPTVAENTLLEIVQKSPVDQMITLKNQQSILRLIATISLETKLPSLLDAIELARLNTSANEQHSFDNCHKQINRLAMSWRTVQAIALLAQLHYSEPPVYIPQEFSFPISRLSLSSGTEIRIIQLSEILEIVYRIFLQTRNQIERFNLNQRHMEAAFSSVLRRALRQLDKSLRFGHNAALILQRGALKSLQDVEFNAALSWIIHYNTAFLHIYGTAVTKQRKVYLFGLQREFAKRKSEHILGQINQQHESWELSSRLLSTEVVCFVSAILEQADLSAGQYFSDLLGATKLPSTQDCQKTILIATHAALESLPFEALTIADGSLVCDSYNVVYLPLLPDADFLGSRRVDSAILAATLSARHSFGHLVDTLNLGIYGRWEERSLAQLFQQQPALNQLWTEIELKALFTNSVVLISCHIEPNANDPANPQLILPCGDKVYLRSILSHQSACKVLILSGCWSASQSNWLMEDGSSVYATVREFGIETLIAAQIPVSAAAAAVYNISLIRNLVAGASTSVAHGRAIRALRKTKICDRYFVPGFDGTTDDDNIIDLSIAKYWAFFRMYGNWR